MVSQISSVPLASSQPFYSSFLKRKSGVLISSNPLQSTWEVGSYEIGSESVEKNPSMAAAVVRRGFDRTTGFYYFFHSPDGEAVTGGGSSCHDGGNGSNLCWGGWLADACGCGSSGLDGAVAWILVTTGHLFGGSFSGVAFAGKWKSLAAFLSAKVGLTRVGPSKFGSEVGFLFGPDLGLWVCWYSCWAFTPSREVWMDWVFMAQMSAIFFLSEVCASISPWLEQI